MDKRLRISLLLDLYGAFLTQRQRETLDLYYNADFSLAEVAQEAGISRQAVHDTIRRGLNALEENEARLGLLGRIFDTGERLDAMRGAMEKAKQGDVSALALLDEQLSAMTKVWETEYGL